MDETPAPKPETLINRNNAVESVRAERAKSDETLREERATTDESLRQERSLTDDLLDDQHNEVVEVVRERRTEAERILRDVRADSDGQLEKHADRLPEMSEKLEHVAESLSKASASLADVAAVLQESSDDLVTNVAPTAEALKDTAQPADVPACDPAPPIVSGALTEQLADIADGIAKITSTLSDERRDVDQGLREEREVTDRLILQELTEVESNLGQELREERHALRQDRQATDEDLANERRYTDDAVEHVQALLAEELQDHAHTARSVATRNEFIGIVSHDLRGPLMTISAVAALMEQQAPTDETGQRIRAWADRVRRSVDVMERLINDLLDFNCFEDGQLQVAAERLDIRSLIHAAMDAFHGVALAKGLSLEADLPAYSVVTKHDPHRMLQVLSNLLQNAIKFTAEGGAIRIRVARAGTFCQVSVSDTGVGIPDGELSEIFERFRQLNPTDRTGLGLGLYISRWIVEAHGGRIWAESQVGVGTTIHFTLPEE
jgi:signal transduction histidine kinase